MAVWSTRFSLWFWDPVWLGIVSQAWYMCMPGIPSITNHIVPLLWSVRVWTIVQILGNGRGQLWKTIPFTWRNCSHEPFFQSNHYHDETRRFIVPLPKKKGVEPLGESRGLTVKRFLSLEKSLQSKGQFQEFAKVVQQYFDMGHAEPVPIQQLVKPCEEVLYLPIHGVTKDSSTTARFRVVFDASVHCKLQIVPLQK